MFVAFLLLLSIIPIYVGMFIYVLFQKNKLSKVIFLFLSMVAVWQMDSAILYADHLLNKDTIEWLFQLLRIGSIMITPTMFYIGYVIVQDLPTPLKEKWKPIINRVTVIALYIVAFIMYIVGWTKQGISELKLIATATNDFYFPVYGDLAWVFYVNIALFFIVIGICFFITLDIQTKSIRLFCLSFMVVSIVGYIVGTLNMFPSLYLVPSSMALLVYSISILIIGSKMHVTVVESINKKLMDQKSFLFKVIDLNPNYIYAKDEQGRYSIINQSYAQLIGANIHEIIGKTDEELADRVKKNVKISDFHDLPQKEFIREEKLTDAAGEEIWVQTMKVPIHTLHQDKLLAVSTDITERKKFEDEITHQANHDALTGLPNRRMFNADLISFLEKAKAQASSIGVLLFDLDRFKYINDTLGHDVGDELLMQVAERLTNLRMIKHPQAIIYRLGGDEFTVLLPNYNADLSEAFAKDLLGLFEEKFILVDSENYISPSIGISMYPEHGEDATGLIKYADTAMYHVKATGKCNYQLFTDEMQHHFYRKMMIEKELRTALEEDEFELYYQPIVDLKSNEVGGVESLIRWHNKVLGQVTPDEFISIAEETGMIVPIGQWILNTALAQHIQWERQFDKKFKVGINVSVRQLIEASFVSDVKAAIERSGVDPAYVILEITESIAMYDESMIEKLHAIKRLGVNLAMDDFGTGYSSLSYLNKYPLDAIKIDKSFVMQLHQDQDSKALVSTMMAIAKQLKLKVVAEGVEDEEAYAFLTEIECDHAQGYYISRPLPAKELKPLLA